MKRAYLQIIILYCLKKLQGQRTIYSILHLLNGKKSSQTIQDAHLFQLTRLFKTFEQLSRDELDRYTEDMERQSWISNNEIGHYTITPEGERILQDVLLKCPLPTSLNGWKHHKSTDVFWGRLSLLVQVISHLNNHHTKYLPVQKKTSIHKWLKSFLLTSGSARNEVGIILYKELLKCFEGLCDISPAVLTLRLTGHNRIGLTAEQAAEQLGLGLAYYRIQFLAALHYLMECVGRNPGSFPLMDKVLSGLDESIPLTLSTEKTYNLLNQGLSIDEIAKIRRLKRSTIEDHVVELALNVSGFDITPYVSNNIQESILHAAHRSNSRQLKHIRQLIPQAEYFEIRLVLARFGEGK
ncbi:helix-turn-helix domain-containing protein [Cytobacillus sp. NCCP-133]|uniref:helix-turn-helix domain-containing protein n=1 Tax=Cytobacillus sp. NCCP-133 TaxID=766848 RepID=UPI0022309835|nr:helix-turn-helix domain-containing protein [Cytobacillus sp. NCCP-133]GLB58032.1 hypothetical protein NCCP133_01650 [Cytobacillus sp. NCCP-133]